MIFNIKPVSEEELMETEELIKPNTDYLQRELLAKVIKQIKKNIGKEIRSNYDK